MLTMFLLLRWPTWLGCAEQTVYNIGGSFLGLLEGAGARLISVCAVLAVLSRGRQRGAVVALVFFTTFAHVCRGGVIFLDYLRGGIFASLYNSPNQEGDNASKK
jgi:hypothetical protein